MATKGRLHSRVLPAVIDAAVDEARARRAPRVGTEHLLVGVLSLSAGEAVAALDFGIDDLRAAIDRFDDRAVESLGLSGAVPPPRSPQWHRRRRPRLTHGTRQAIVRAAEWTRSQGRSRISELDLLRGVLGGSAPDPAVQILRSLDIDVDAVISRL